MDTLQAIDVFAALSQETRLDTFRLLVRHEPNGLAAGKIARQLGVPHNTLSTHLAVLSRAGLILAERQSRSIIYRADLSRMEQTLRFLVRDCCAGDPKMCETLRLSLIGCDAESDTR
ncbi:MAG: metalloregulator ArsR/SmtB family transcription factor [Salinisphaera sp.]|jgi:ArsR family transcriptional regulator|nr:metalloregulator ArsR/SmtB family transcription factor [Salinisphaera sp.]